MQQVEQGAAPARTDNALVTVDGAGQFPAWVNPRERWNGWLVPRFTKATADQLMAWLNAEHEQVGKGSDRAEWDGEVWVHHSPMYEDDPGYRPERLQPGQQDGRYPIGGYSWCWCYVGPDQLRVPVPPAGDREQYAANFAAWLGAAAQAGIEPSYSTHDYLSELEHLDGMTDGHEARVAGLVAYRDGTTYLIEQQGDQVVAEYVGRSKA
mgnify:CR=1 FL=1